MNQQEQAGELPAWCGYGAAIAGISGAGLAIMLATLATNGAIHHGTLAVLTIVAAALLHGGATGLLTIVAVKVVVSAIYQQPQVVYVHPADTRLEKRVAALEQRGVEREPAPATANGHLKGTGAQIPNPMVYELGIAEGMRRLKTGEADSG